MKGLNLYLKKKKATTTTKKKKISFALNVGISFCHWPLNLTATVILKSLGQNWAIMDKTEQ